MLDGIVTASFEDIIKTDNIRINVGVWVINTITNSSLGSEVHDDVRLIFLEGFVDEFFVGKIAFDKCEVFVLL